MVTGTRPPPASGVARALTQNALWSLAGVGIPILAGLRLIPILIQALGFERFGLLALLWMDVGYFSLFDLGLG